MWLSGGVCMIVIVVCMLQLDLGVREGLLKRSGAWYAIVGREGESFVSVEPREDRETRLF